MKKSLLLSLALSAGFLGAAGYNVGDLVKINDNINAYVTAIRSPHHYSVEVFANADNKPTGDLVVPYFMQQGDDVFTISSVRNEGFQYCEITSLMLPPSCLHVGNYAFNGCTVLKSVGETGSEAGVSSLGEYAFGYNFALESLDLKALEYIGNFAFVRSALKEVSLPEIIKIGAGAFQECYSLETFVAGPTLKTIENIAFVNDKALVQVTLQNGLETVGVNAFAFCEALEEIVIPRSVTSMGRDSFAGSGYKRVFILNENYMDFVDSDVLTHSSITEIYCAPSLVGPINEYLDAQRAANALNVPQATAQPVTDLLKATVITASKDNYTFTLESQIEGIANVKVYTADTQKLITPSASGFYTNYDPKIIVDYTVDTYNSLNYEMELPLQDAVAEIEAEIQPIEYYTLQGIKVKTPTPGIYITRRGDKVSKTIIAE